jgi:catechol 2,3-dioxygenase-like lactoylglutathione lyase family enzyme
MNLRLMGGIMSRAITGSHTRSGAGVEKVDMKFEAVVIPVADVDRSKEFYTTLGWRLDADFPFDNGFRVVQFTPPGSGCSVQFGKKITSAAPGSAQGLYLIASDVEAARRDLVARGIDVSEVFHPGTPGAQFQIDGSGRITGQHPSMPPTTRSPLFVIPTAMVGCFRKSQRGCPAEDLVIWMSRR